MDVHPTKNGMYRYWSIAIWEWYCGWASGILHHLGCLKSYKSWDVYHLSTGDLDFAGPSTVGFGPSRDVWNVQEKWAASSIYLHVLHKHVHTHICWMFFWTCLTKKHGHLGSLVDAFTVQTVAFHQGLWQSPTTRTLCQHVNFRKTVVGWWGS